MAVLAVPHNRAFCIEKQNEDILYKRHGTTLNALRKIRKAEASTTDTSRLRQLDERIDAVLNEGRKAESFYRRLGFENFVELMEQPSNWFSQGCIPMFLNL